MTLSSHSIPMFHNVTDLGLDGLSKSAKICHTFHTLNLSPPKTSGQIRGDEAVWVEIRSTNRGRMTSAVAFNTVSLIQPIHALIHMTLHTHKDTWATKGCLVKPSLCLYMPSAFALCSRRLWCKIELPVTMQAIHCNQDGFLFPQRGVRRGVKGRKQTPACGKEI